MSIHLTISTGRSADRELPRNQQEPQSNKSVQIPHAQSMVADERGRTNRANIHTPMWKSL